MAQFSHTWWGERFLEALERFTDPARLGRGRSYARTGRILSYALEGNTIRARVRGSINPYFGVYKEPIYTTEISLKPIAMADWRRVISHLASRASVVAKLLMNEMPDTIDQAVGELGVHLLPESERDFTTDCSCPDWANPCKHIAGVYYLLAGDLDRDPFLLFELRGLAREDLRRQLAASPLGQILAAGLQEEAVEIEAADSYYTVPTTRPAGEITHHDFWVGARRLPSEQPMAAPTQDRQPVSGLLIKRLGDYPAFWQKDASFLETMDTLYERVRSKSPNVK